MYLPRVVSKLQTRGTDARTTELELRGAILAERYEVLKLLGVGSHGAVYEAHDRRRDRRVAVKVLRRIDPEALYRFKREFRMLSDVSHPNLVTLYELYVDDQIAFFTMRLVRGTPTMAWIRPNDTFDEERLRAVFSQLATGLSVLHRMGRLHCDLKPSNVLVDDDGHVALADFGLARELRPSEGHEDDVVGTPAYMSPEQAAARELGPKSDWYGVGAMLYEALTGAPPFAPLDGLPLLMMKQASNPPPPGALVTGLPEDLERLCMELLSTRSSDRPDAHEIARRLGAPTVDVPERDDDEHALYGRETELGLLGAALWRTRHPEEGDASVVFVEGLSGVGKTALLQHFSKNIHRTAEVVVLEGRCYERESVPYKGLDVLVDALRVKLLEDTKAEQRLPWPRQMSALARLFPVLRDLPGLSAPSPALEDPISVRREALGALAELLHRFCERAPLVLQLDDAQWCDRDSIRFIADLLRPSRRPRLALVFSVRTEDLPRPPPLLELRERLSAPTSGLSIQRVVVNPLPTAVARALANDHLARTVSHEDFDDPGRRDDMADAIAKASSGNPLFVLELARHVALTGGGLHPDLSATIVSRATTLSGGARRLLEAIAVAGRPIPQQVAIAAGDVDESELESLVELQSRAFIRTHGSDPFDAVETYHDGITTAIATAVPRDRFRSIHGKLAQELVRMSADPEVLAYHFEAADAHETAARHYAAAASAASSTYAFDQAARLFRRALDLIGPNHPDRPELTVSLADALASDGRGTEAGRTYLRALHGAPDDQAIELRRRAAEQLLRSGKIDEGLEQLGHVLRAVGLALPRSPLVATGSLVWQRLKLRLRRASHPLPRHETYPSSRELLRIDTCWAAATGLTAVNVVQGQAFQAQHLLLSLRAGEPSRIARALGMEMLYATTAGEHGAETTKRGLAELQALAQRLDDPRALGMAALADGAADLYRGRFLEARPKLRQAERILRKRASNVAWELSMTHTFQVMVEYHLGRFESMIDTIEGSLEDAAARDDLHTALMIRVAYGPVQNLVEGRVEVAREELETCRRQWSLELSRPTFRYSLMLSQARVERYAGSHAECWTPFERHWPAVRRSLMLIKQPFRIFSLHDRGCSALTAARTRNDRSREFLLSRAKRDANALLRENVGWATSFAYSLFTAIRAAEHDLIAATREAFAAREAFERMQMAAYAAAMHLRLAELHGWTRDREEAEARLRELGVVDPQCMADMLVPPVLGW
jgi:eukaryotic-like serine/threonine-protein kinase